MTKHARPARKLSLIRVMLLPAVCVNWTPGLRQSGLWICLLTVLARCVMASYRHATPRRWHACGIGALRCARSLRLPKARRVACGISSSLRSVAMICLMTSTAWFTRSMILSCRRNWVLFHARRVGRLHTNFRPRSN